MKLVIDTNVIIDVICNREPFFRDSQNILLLCASDEIEGYISAKSIIDIINGIQVQQNSINNKPAPIFPA